MATLACFKNNQKGQTLVEFAIILPVVLFLLFGVIQLGVIYYGNINLAGAVREGARMVSVGTDDESAINKMNSLASSIPYMELKNIEIYPEERTLSHEVIVSADASIKIFVPFLGKAIGDTFDISRSTTMVYQGSF